MALYRATIIGTFMGQIFNNVLNFQNRAGVMTADQVANEVASSWVNTVKGLQTASVVYNNVRVQELAAGPPAAFSLPINVIGGNTGSSVEYSFVAIVMKIQTATGGRHGRGRVMLPGLRQNTQANNLISASELVNWNNIVRTPLEGFFHGTTGTSPLRLGVMGRAIDSTFHPMTSLDTRSVIGTCRRRMIGRGF